MDYLKWPNLTEDEIPSYVQIYDIIFNLIKEDKLKPGDKLPGENVLADKWNVSRATVRLAIRKLAEDGYISKMQGKRTTVADHSHKLEHDLNWVFNPCIGNCIQSVTDIRVSVELQKIGRYIADKLKYSDVNLKVVVFDLDYFADDIKIATSVCIFPVNYLETWNIDIDDKEAVKKFVCEEIYSLSKRSMLTMTVSGESVYLPDAESVVVLEECLCGESDEVFAYCRYNLNGEWYRFSINRRCTP